MISIPPNLIQGSSRQARGAGRFHQTHDSAPGWQGRFAETSVLGPERTPRRGGIRLTWSAAGPAAAGPKVPWNALRLGQPRSAKHLCEASLPGSGSWNSFGVARPTAASPGAATVVRSGKACCSGGESPPSSAAGAAEVQNESNEWKGLANHPRPRVARRKDRSRWT